MRQHQVPLLAATHFQEAIQMQMIVFRKKIRAKHAPFQKLPKRSNLRTRNHYRTSLIRRCRKI